MAKESIEGRNSGIHLWRDRTLSITVLGNTGVGIPAKNPLEADRAG
ncbi:MAG: hypothetical protein HC924_12015 [Synechococcaceae cyanobacterium SM2_3_2]|nr:hypothetical protein [Synechococcaceae cyanobacterium SM2_3_2]